MTRQRLRLVAWGLGGLGLVGTILGWRTESDQLPHAWLAAFNAWLAWPLGCLGLLLIHALTGGRWGYAIRPQLVSGIRTLWLVVPAAVPCMLTLPELYVWARPGAGAHLGNSFYLNRPFFFGRAAIYLVCWLGLSALALRALRMGTPAPDADYAADAASTPRAAHAPNASSTPYAPEAAPSSNADHAPYAAASTPGATSTSHAASTPYAASVPHAVLAPNTTSTPYVDAASNPVASHHAALAPHEASTHHGASAPVAPSTPCGRSTPDAVSTPHADAAPNAALARIAPGGLIVLALTITFSAIDLTQSLDPHFTSSVYGMITMSEMGLFALAVAIFAASFAIPAVPSDTLAVLGKLTLGLVLLWAYLDFMQLLIVWESDLPSEAAWYHLRTTGGWGITSALIHGGHFVLPWCALIYPPLRRSPRGIAVVAALLALSAIVRSWWLVLPASGFSFSAIDVSTMLCLLGIGAALSLTDPWGRPHLPFAGLASGDSHGG